MYDDGSWSDDESRESRRPRTRDHHLTSLRSARSSPVVPRPVQSLLDKRETLLSVASARTCASFGRTQAVLDACRLALVVSMLREAVPLFLRALSSSVSPNAEPLGGDIRRAVISTLLSSALDGLTPDDGTRRTACPPGGMEWGGSPQPYWIQPPRRPDPHVHWRRCGLLYAT